MSKPKNSAPTGQALPPLPLTLEGSAVLHQMFRLRWPAWKALPEAERAAIAAEAAEKLAALDNSQSALFSVLGHKAELMLVHFRPDFPALKQLEAQMTTLGVWQFLEPSSSYLSVVELGLYESTVKLYETLIARGVVPESPEWEREVQQVIATQKKAMQPRLFPEVPASRYLCFYPMDRKRGETKNWYRLSLAERQRQMHEHGLIGRRYAGQVKQIITGSIGFDDWEWGVDLFADDPLTFKKLIYEMRFDEVSADYALFGTFYVGIRCPAAKLGDLLAGRWDPASR